MVARSRPRPSEDSPRGDDQWLVEGYRAGLSTYQLAQRAGISRQAVSRRLRAAGVTLSPRGAGRRRPAPRLAEPDDLRALLHEWYLVRRLTSRQIGDLLGWSERTVRNRIAELGLPSRTRGRCNREDRRSVPVEDLNDLYVRDGLPAAEVGVKVGASATLVLRCAHEWGLPVRTGGNHPRVGTHHIELIEALYADPLVGETLARHHVPPVPAGGPIWRRFPRPVRLTGALLTDLYVRCGLSAMDIELLTGQPAATVLRHLHALGVPLRPRGGRSPFRRRWGSAARSAAGAGIPGRRTDGPVPAAGRRSTFVIGR